VFDRAGGKWYFLHLLKMQIRDQAVFQVMRSQAANGDIFESGLMPYDEALSRILAGVSPVLESERVPLERACGRILHTSVVSAINVPAHTNSGVDGYALHAADIAEDGSARLVIKDTALAGEKYSGTIGRGECLRIMTGAAVPEPLDTVVMQEHVELVYGGRSQADAARRWIACIGWRLRSRSQASAESGGCLDRKRG
jgi:hypothetical protein